MDCENAPQSGSNNRLPLSFVSRYCRTKQLADLVRDMDVARAEEQAWRGPSGHRQGGLGFKDIFLGDEGPGNYWFTLVKIEDYAAPPHRHNFDQVRFMLSGGFAFGDQLQPQGSVGYFTEGVTYTQKADGPNTHLLLQCEGGGRATYISARQLEVAVQRLSQTGRFEKGRYTDETDRGPRTRDGFEACWEEVTGQSAKYTSPRYDRPLIMFPESFASVEDPDHPGVSRKLLGRFTERELEIGFLTMAAGCDVTLSASDADTLFYALEGEGTVPAGTGGEGEQSWGVEDGLRLRAGDYGRITSAKQSQLFYIGLPR